MGFHVLGSRELSEPLGSGRSPTVNLGEDGALFPSLPHLLRGCEAVGWEVTSWLPWGSLESWDLTRLVWGSVQGMRRVLTSCSQGG